MSAQCSCCTNHAFVDGRDLTVKSSRAMVELDEKTTCKVGVGRVEIRVSLTARGALEIIDSLIVAFPEVKAHLGMKLHNNAGKGCHCDNRLNDSAV